VEKRWRNFMRDKVIGFALGVLLVAFSDSSGAQRPKVPTIGFLSTGSASVFATRVDALKSGLRDLGYVEGQNITIEYRWAEGKTERLPALAAELVSQKVDLMLTPGTSGSVAVKKATSTIPIVFVGVGSPEKVGLVASFARPRANATGLTQIAQELGTKRLELLIETFPNTRRVIYLTDADSPGSVLSRQEVEAAAKSLAVQFQAFGLRDLSELDGAIASAKKGGVGALNISGGAFNTFNMKRIVELVAKNRLPAIYADSEFTDAGGLMSYGPSYSAMFRRAATYVDKILKGTKPADLPVERPTKFEFVINLKTAKQIGLTIPPNVLARADRVIR
jgi:putative tryptophan/tyrosine transport system substrate-binding protein